MIIDPESPPPLYEAMPELLNTGIVNGSPHAKEIGITVVKIRRAEAIAKLAYDQKLIGNPETGVVHGGVITTLLDHTSGMAVMATLEFLSGIATLDLRIDYMRPATPGETIFAKCNCFRLTRSVAFVQGKAYHQNEDKPIGTCVAAFMLTGKRMELPAKASQ